MKRDELLVVLGDTLMVGPVDVGRQLAAHGFERVGRAWERREMVSGAAVLEVLETLEALDKPRHPEDLEARRRLVSRLREEVEWAAGCEL